MSVRRADEHNARARERREAKCRHFNGVAHDQCEAGVAYSTVKDDSVKPHRWPCLDPDCATTCERRSLHTVEELDEQDRQRAASLRRIFTARRAIAEATGGKRRVQGTIDCPNCADGKLRYSVASNGHVWGSCTTKGCASWME
jgi:hypothetical protein